MADHRDALNEEAADAQQEQHPDERVVLEVGMRAEQPSVSDDVSAVDRHRGPYDEQQAKGIEHELVGQIEVTPPERLPRQHVVDVEVDEEDGGPDQQHEKAPHDERVHEPGVEVAIELFLVRSGDPRSDDDPVSEIVEALAGILLARCVADETLVDTVNEDDDGDDREEVEHPSADGTDLPERLAGDLPATLCDDEHDRSPG